MMAHIAAIPIAGLSAANVNAQTFAPGLTLLWRPPIKLAEGLSYVMSAMAPAVRLDVEGDVSAEAFPARRSTTSAG